MSLLPVAPASRRLSRGRPALGAGNTAVQSRLPWKKTRKLRAIARHRAGGTPALQSDSVVPVGAVVFLSRGDRHGQPVLFGRQRAGGVWSYRTRRTIGPIE